MNVQIGPNLISQIVTMGHELDRAEPELRGIIDRLSEDQQAELVALMWIGRGTFEPGEWSEALQTAETEASIPCADYLIGTPHFPDHLVSGAEVMKIPMEIVV